MENNNDNDNKNEPKVTTSKTIEVAETVEKPKKQKRKFEWTPKRKAAFKKCVAADSSLWSSSEEYKKSRRKGLKKQFTFKKRFDI
jgi:hypothetical protein